MQSPIRRKKNGRPVQFCIGLFRVGGPNFVGGGFDYKTTVAKVRFRSSKLWFVDSFDRKNYRAAQLFARIFSDRGLNGGFL